VQSPVSLQNPLQHSELEPHSVSPGLHIAPPDPLPGPTPPWPSPPWPPLLAATPSSSSSSGRDLWLSEHDAPTIAASRNELAKSKPKRFITSP
jgi:hypothetical protein